MCEGTPINAYLKKMKMKMLAYKLGAPMSEEDQMVTLLGFFCYYHDCTGG